MKRFPAALALGLGCCTAPPSSMAQQGLAEELAGRVAGTAQHCVPMSSTQSLRVSDNNRHTLLYGGGRTIWANALPPNCSFRFDDVLVTEPMGSYYCRGDIVRSFDRISRIPGPSCVLGDFIPYGRP